MAKYRAIYTKIWDDPDFQEYDSDVKLIFIYLCTNPLTTESGIYAVTCKTIANHIGIALETVSQRLINGYIKNVFYDQANKVVFVKNLRNYNPAGGRPDLIEKSIIEDYRLSSKCSELWQLFIETYPEFEGKLNNRENSQKESTKEILDKSNSIVSNSVVECSIEPLTKGLSTDSQQLPQLESNFNIFKLYEENIEPIKPMIADALRLLQTEYEDKWIVDAIKECVKANVKKYSYLQAILENWRQHGKGNGKNDKQRFNSYPLGKKRRTVYNAKGEVIG